ncbi:MAG: hypothetical protein ACI8UD_002026 [Planctomycetota bacterium]
MSLYLPTALPFVIGPMATSPDAVATDRNLLQIAPTFWL